MLRIPIPFLALLALACLHQPLQAWERHDSFLRRFVGQWKGVYSISTLYGKNLGSYTMEQSYYWMDGRLYGATAVQLPDKKIQYEYSEVWYDGSILRSIVENEKHLREYYGWMETGQIWWQSHFDSMAEFHQLTTEQLQPTSKGFQLIMNGHQWSQTEGRLEFLHIRAELIRLKKGQHFELMETLPE